MGEKRCVRVRKAQGERRAESVFVGCHHENMRKLFISNRPTECGSDAAHEPVCVCVVWFTHRVCVARNVQQVVCLSEGQSACQSVPGQDTEPYIGPSGSSISVCVYVSVLALCFNVAAISA